MELLYVVEINDRIAMHTEKTIWIKHRLEVLQALPKQMRGISNVEANVVPRRLHPLDIFDANKHNLLTRFHCQSLYELPQGRPGFVRLLIGLGTCPSARNSRFSVGHRSLGAVVIKRLNQLIACNRVKCRYCHRIADGGTWC